MEKYFQFQILKEHYFKRIKASIFLNQCSPISAVELKSQVMESQLDHFNLGSEVPIGIVDSCQLSPDDLSEFNKLKEYFHQQQSTKQSDRHVSSFPQEIQKIIMFIERRVDDRENRAIASGLAYNGSFICVNTRQLKHFIGRCKSSINSGFQQLGYSSLKTKSRAHACLLSVLPSLSNDVISSRQWTVRICMAFPQFIPVMEIRPIIPQMTQKVSKPIPLVVPMIANPNRQQTSPPEIGWENPFQGCDLVASEEYQFHNDEWDLSIPSVW